MIQVLFSKELTSAICWTLVHSLWQGLILALVTGVTMIATRKSEARKRYRLLVALFMVFATVSIATFFIEWQRATALAEQLVPAAAVYSTTDNAGIAPVVTGDNTVTYNQQLISRIKDYLDNNASLIVTLWMIIFLARFVQFTGELVYVQRLKHHKVVPVSGHWRRKLALLAEKLDLGKPIRLLESGMVKVPVVMGVLKPVILLPAGLITRLPEDEIEAILLHELAHIKRIDYFVNLLQRFAETLFFFNPALLWLSSMIREERENCCDDIAVAVTNNKTHFINALISFQEYNLSNKNYAMTFPGKKNHLLNRAKRLIDSRNKTLNTTEKSFLSLGMGLLLVFSFATARTVTPVDKKVTEEQTVAAHHEIDTVYTGGEKSAGSFSAVAQDHATSDIVDTVPAAPKRKAVPATTPATTPAAPAAPSAPGSPAAVPAAPAAAPRSSVPANVVAPVPPVPPAISSDFSSKSTNSHTVDKNRELTVEATSRDGHDYRLRKTNDQVKELVIDGVKIDPASYKDYKELIDKLDSPDDGRRSMDFNKSEWKKTKPRGKGDNAEAGATSVPDKFTMDADVNMQRTKVNTDAKWEGKAEWKKTDSLKKNNGQRFRATQDKKAALDEEVVAKNMEGVTKKMQQKNLAADSDAIKRKIAAEARKAEAEIRKAKLEEQKKRHDEQRKVAAEQMLKIVEDIKANNVAFDMDKSWFALDPKKFVVNGQNMTEALHKTFTQKYLTNNGMGYYLGNVKLDGRGIFLSNKDLTSR